MFDERRGGDDHDGFIVLQRMQVEADDSPDVVDLDVPRVQ
jgi:hypothetical protein